MTELKSYWNQSLSKNYLRSRQDPDGAYTDAGLTSDVLLALMDKGLGSIRLMDCGRHDADYENNGNKGINCVSNSFLTISFTVEIEGLTKSLSSQGNDSEIRNITITYTLWIGSNITENFTISITAPRNTSFYSIMQVSSDNVMTFFPTDFFLKN